jgi:hypothetical protein
MLPSELCCADAGARQRDGARTRQRPLFAERERNIFRLLSSTLGFLSILATSRSTGPADASAPTGVKRRARDDARPPNTKPVATGRQTRLVAAPGSDAIVQCANRGFLAGRAPLGNLVAGAFA